MIWIQAITTSLALIIGILPQFLTIDVEEVNDKKRKVNFFQSLNIIGKILFIVFVLSVPFSMYFNYKDVKDTKNNMNTLDSIVKTAKASLTIAQGISENTVELGDSLSLTNAIALELTGKMLYLTKEQEEITQSSNYLLQNARFERENAHKMLKNNLDATIRSLQDSYQRIWIYNSSFDKMSHNDSIAFHNKLIGYTTFVIALLNSQQSNPILSNNINLYRFWNDILSLTQRIQSTLYGYGFESLSRENDKLNLIAETLREKLEFYWTESTYLKLYPDSNLYKIDINDLYQRISNP